MANPIGLPGVSLSILARQAGAYDGSVATVVGADDSVSMARQEMIVPQNWQPLDDRRVFEATSAPAFPKSATPEPD